MQLLQRLEVECTIKFIRHCEALFIDLCAGKAVANQSAIDLSRPFKINNERDNLVIEIRF